MFAKSKSEKRILSDSQPTEKKKTDLDDNSSIATDMTWDIVEVESEEPRNSIEELRNPSSKLPWAFCKCGLSLINLSN